MLIRSKNSHLPKAKNPQTPVKFSATNAQIARLIQSTQVNSK
ncbi:hypothetical protein [Cyanobacterium stanieri]|nr:hypothetical protein [Cyanobacterium stanieri]